MFRRALLPLLCSLPLFSQCSDAGVCALERSAPGPEHRVALLGQYGRSGSPDDLSFQSLRLEAQVALGETRSLALTLPWVRVSGPLGGRSGPGDALLVLDQELARGSWGRLRAQVGARLPTGKDAEGGLPLRYQTGLGGTDLLLGGRWDGATWQAGLGYQRAGSRSANAVDPLRRRDDLLVHVGARGAVGKGEGSLRLVALQRLGLSDLRQPDGSLRKVPDSDRLQLNLAGALSLPLSGGWSLEGRLALPLLKRPDNTDGLKRALTAALGVGRRF